MLKSIDNFYASFTFLLYSKKNYNHTLLQNQMEFGSLNKKHCEMWETVKQTHFLYLILKKRQVKIIIVSAG